jgi:hypothetical protein
VLTAINYLMLDYLACLFSGYETDAGRAAARLSQRYPMTGDFKSTVWGASAEKHLAAPAFDRTLEIVPKSTGRSHPVT